MMTKETRIMIQLFLIAFVLDFVVELRGTHMSWWNYEKSAFWLWTVPIEIPLVMGLATVLGFCLIKRMNFRCDKNGFKTLIIGLALVSVALWYAGIVDFLYTNILLAILGLSYIPRSRWDEAVLVGVMALALDFVFELYFVGGVSGWSYAEGFVSSIPLNYFFNVLFLYGMYYLIKKGARR